MSLSFSLLEEDDFCIFRVSNSITLSNIVSSASTPSVTTGSDSNSEFLFWTTWLTIWGPLLITSSISSTISFSGFPELGAISIISFSSSSIYSISGILFANSSSSGWGYIIFKASIGICKSVYPNDFNDTNAAVFLLDPFLVIIVLSPLFLNLSII